jgi:pantothenate kinase
MENPYQAANSAPEIDTAPLPEDAVRRLTALLARGKRTILGIAAGPGAGKSTLAQALHALFPADTCYLPMDGFHLANREIARLGLAHCKGAPETFDSAGYVHLLRRLKAQPPGETVYAPDFDRRFDEPVAGAIAIAADTPLVITEGNYLLLNEGPWVGVRDLLDEAWYLDLDPDERHRRLLGRHMQFGRSEQDARAWIASSDEPNARRIAQTRHRADWILMST